MTPVVAAESIRYEVPGRKWEASLGTHRAVVRVDAAAPASRVRLEWRRRDPEPEKKGVIVVDAATGQRVTNVVALAISAEAGDIVFEPTSGAGEYDIYFLPGDPGHGSFPTAKYLPPQDTAAAEWKTKIAGASVARVVRWEARTEHDGFTGMEIIATAAEREAWLAQHPEAIAAFIEPASRPVRMFDHVPQRWLQPHAAEEPEAGPGEPLIFQIGIWAARGALRNVRVRFSDLGTPEGQVLIPAAELHCFQLGGTDVQGQPLEGRVEVPAGGVLSLWCGLHVPAVPEGRIAGTVEISADGVPPQRVPLAIRVSAHGDPERALAEPERLAKLFWLDSTIAQEDGPTQGFEPVTVQDRVIHVLGRTLTLGTNGLPERITSFFQPGITRLAERPTEILAGPMRFVVEQSDGRAAPLIASDFHFTKTGLGAAEWTSTLAGGGVSLVVNGRMEFDGQVELRCTLAAAQAVELKDVRLEIPRTTETVKYAAGLGLYGGATPAAIDWHWDVLKKDQDALWLGAVNAGLRVQLRAENYVRPMVNIHYRRQPLNDPPSWSNGGVGGLRWDGRVMVTAYSGARTLEPGKPLHFDCDLSITPFKLLNTTAQWRDRYYQVSGVPAAPEKVREAGANVVNIHQGNALNPYINYPFLTADKLAAYTTQAHAAGMRVKYYYTVRELTNWTPELFALRAFGDELIAPGRGGGQAWCEEHLGGNYWGAWYEPGVNDASVLTASMSRFHNFYLDGLDWLVKHTGCDGIYLDDISYDRTVMKRARRILDRDPRGGLIDLHSWNEMNSSAGYASCALLFMDSFPFVDRLWLGEGHHYDGPPEQTLVAVSGIPFGLMGEMLQDGGNPWLGLTFGMTGRLGWGGNPQPVWKLWDDFGAAGSDFTGWWDSASPVKASAPECRATIWRREGKTLIAVGNFGDQPVRTTLAVDFAALGLDPKKAHLYAPEMKGFQPELLFASDAAISIAPKRGFAFILDETPRQAAQAAESLVFDKTKLLFEDAFVPAPGVGWKTVASEPAASVKPDREGLVFLAPANVHAWVERPLPAGAGVVSAELRQDSGDEAQQWGPGLALVWPDGKLLKVNRRKDGRFGVAVGGTEKLAGMCDLERPVTLTFVIEQETIRIVASGEGVYQQDQELARVPRAGFSAAPSVVRVGKMPNDGAAKDHTVPGLMGWSRADWLRIYR